MNVTVDDAVRWFEKSNEKIQENKQYLTKLDQPIGDGDHGINMARGFAELVKVMHAEEFKTVSDVMKTAAMTIMSKVGGASGPLYGTAFLRMSFVFKDKETIDFTVLKKGLTEALLGLKKRGRAKEGEKTLVDVWESVVNELEMMDTFKGDKMIAAAENAMLQTKETMATKGRASYFKEKSIGHVDPGAVSSFYILKSLAEVLDGGG